MPCQHRQPIRMSFLGLVYAAGIAILPIGAMICAGAVIDLAAGGAAPAGGRWTAFLERVLWACSAMVLLLPLLAPAVTHRAGATVTRHAVAQVNHALLLGVSLLVMAGAQSIASGRHPGMWISGPAMVFTVVCLAAWFVAIPLASASGMVRIVHRLPPLP